MKNILKYILLIILGIVISLSWNNIDGFSIGGPGNKFIKDMDSGEIINVEDRRIRQIHGIVLPTPPPTAAEHPPAGGVELNWEGWTPPLPAAGGYTPPPMTQEQEDINFGLQIQNFLALNPLLYQQWPPPQCPVAHGGQATCPAPPESGDPGEQQGGWECPIQESNTDDYMWPGLPWPNQFSLDLSGVEIDDLLRLLAEGRYPDREQEIRDRLAALGFNAAQIEAGITGLPKCGDVEPEPEPEDVISVEEEWKGLLLAIGISPEYSSILARKMIEMFPPARRSSIFTLLQSWKPYLGGGEPRGSFPGHPRLPREVCQSIVRSATTGVLGEYHLPHIFINFLRDIFMLDRSRQHWHENLINLNPIFEDFHLLLPFFNDPNYTRDAILEAYIAYLRNEAYGLQLGGGGRLSVPGVVSPYLPQFIWLYLSGRRLDRSRYLPGEATLREYTGYEVVASFRTRTTAGGGDVGRAGRLFRYVTWLEINTWFNTLGGPPSLNRGSSNAGQSTPEPEPSGADP